MSASAISSQQQPRKRVRPTRSTVTPDRRRAEFRLLRGAIAELTGRCGGNVTPEQRELIEQAATLRLLLFKLARAATTADVVQIGDARTYTAVSKQYVSLCDRLARGGQPDRRHERVEAPEPPEAGDLHDLAIDFDV